MYKLTGRSMRLLAAIAVICWAGAASAADNKLTSSEKRQGWTLLFDGKTLNGWTVSGKSEGWQVENGAIACTNKGGGYVYTIGKWSDFTLKCDVRYVPGCNSGVFFRWENPNDPVQTGMEIQVLDSFGRNKPGKHDFGSLYDCLEPSAQAARPASEWNTLEMTCRGTKLKVIVNGTKVMDTDLAAWTQPHKNPDGTENKFDRAYCRMLGPGHIGFQDHGSQVWYKNIRLRSYDRPRK